MLLFLLQGSSMKLFIIITEDYEQLRRSTLYIINKINVSLHKHWIWKMNQCISLKLYELNIPSAHLILIWARIGGESSGSDDN